MSLTNVLRVAGFSTLLFACAGIAAAQGPTAGTTTSAELAMTATVETTLQLNISTGVSGALVTGNNATGLFALNFGSVNGLGVGSSPSANVNVVADATGATYTTPINLTPVYSGFTTETADVTVKEGASANQLIAREGPSAAGVIAVTATPAVAFSDKASGSSNERFVGFRIDRTEVAGAKTATLIYTVTMAL